MDADQPLKSLFRLRAPSLLRLIGEAGARVLSVRVVELPASRRSVDTVLRLRRGRETYLRHVEFEMRYRRGLELRLFDYALRLRVQLRLPVVTTVLLLQPPAPKRLGYHEEVGGRVVCTRDFDMVRLWELDPEQLLDMGAGPATLVGRAQAAGVQHVREAARLIARTTQPPERNDLLFILQALCGERYTSRELGRMIPREAVMASVMFAKEFKQARAEGRAEGARVVCLDVMRLLHPAAVGKVAPAVAACQSPRTLRDWTLAAARLPSAELVRLVSESAERRGVSVSRRRAPRPSRRSASSRRR